MTSNHLPLEIEETETGPLLSRLSISHHGLLSDVPLSIYGSRAEHSLPVSVPLAVTASWRDGFDLTNWF